MKSADKILAFLAATDGVWCPGVRYSGYRGEWVAECRLPANKPHRCAGSWLKAMGKTPLSACRALLAALAERGRKLERCDGE